MSLLIRGFVSEVRKAKLSPLKERSFILVGSAVIMAGVFLATVMDKLIKFFQENA